MKKIEGQICIGGYAGCGNLGDDAILQGVLAKLEHPDNTIVLSGNPKRDRERFGVRCVNRLDPVAGTKALCSSERFLCGGGSLLQNETGNLSLLYYLSLLALSLKCGCKPELLAAGIGPLHGESAIRHTVSLLNRCAAIELRDNDSLSYLTRLGVDPSLLSLVPDPAFSLPPPPPSRLPFLLQETGLSPDTSYFCVAVRSSDKHAPYLLPRLTVAIRLIRQEHGAIPVFLPLDTHADLAATSRLSTDTQGKIARLREASDAIAWLGGAQFSIGMRLHALIFSVMANIPTVGISPSEREPKLLSFCRSHAIPHFSPSTLSVPALVDKIKHL